jgi:hypothetical protein
MSECDRVSKTLRAAIERLVAVDHLLMELGELEPYIPYTERDVYDRLRRVFLEKQKREWEEVESLLRELPKACR